MRFSRRKGLKRRNKTSTQQLFSFHYRALFCVGWAEGRCVIRPPRRGCSCSDDSLSAKPPPPPSAKMGESDSDEEKSSLEIENHGHFHKLNKKV